MDSKLPATFRIWAWTTTWQLIRLTKYGIKNAEEIARCRQSKRVSCITWIILHITIAIKALGHFFRSFYWINLIEPSRILIVLPISSVIPARLAVTLVVGKMLFLLRTASGEVFAIRQSALLPDNI